MDLSKKNLRTKFFIILTIGVYILWAGAFIYKSSFVAIDSNRYFSLFDDAMISMRYAWNFSHGNGLVWNPGEMVEGYTNFLMTLIMSATTFFFNDKNAVLTIQVLGILTVVAVSWQTRRLYLLVVGDDSNPMLFALIPVLIFIYYPLSYWSLMGMETGLVTFLILLSFNAVIKYEQNDLPTQLFLSALFASLSYLARPDSGLIILPILLFILTRRTGWKIRVLNGLKFGLIFLILPASHMVFRYSYYGELLPNTYFLKLTGLSTANRLKAGLVFVFPFLTSTLPLWIFAGLSTVLNFNRRKLMLLSTSILYVFYQIWVGGDAWNYWRMVTPIVPLIIILFLDEFYIFIHAFIQSLLNPFWNKYLNRRPFWKLDVPKFPKISETILSRVLIIVGCAGILLILFAEIPGIGKAGFGPTQQIFLAVIVVFILFAWMIDASNQEYTKKIHTVFFTIGISAVLLFANIRFIPQMVFHAPPFQTQPNQSTINLAVAINASTDPEASVGVFWAGTIPYYTHRYAIDFLGKSDTYIAHLPPVEGTTVNTMPGHNKFDLSYSILGLQPDYVPGFSWGGQDIVKEAPPLYEQVEYEGVRMYFLKDSANVNWNLVTIIPE